MAKRGVILVNIGTPKTPEPKDVAKYLRQFLMDPYVIEWNGFFRYLLVNGIIAPFRSKKSSGAYKKIWRDDGSPLLIYTEKLKDDLSFMLGSEYKVVVGMRYSEPSMEQALEELADCDEIVLFPQYPQYAQSSYKTSVEYFNGLVKKHHITKPVHIMHPFFDEPGYIQSYSEIIGETLKGKKYDHLLFSYHGLPESHLKLSDPTGKHCLNYPTCCEKSEKVINFCYRAQCFTTTKLIATSLGLDESKYSVGFQSRLTKAWIPPFTDKLIEEYPAKGIKNIAVVCPSFTADCLETLEEVAMGLKETFLEKGGESFEFVPCLNNHPTWVAACAEWLRRLDLTPEKSSRKLSEMPLL